MAILKKILILISIILCCLLLNKFFTNDDNKEYYSLSTLKGLFKETETMILCPRDRKEHYKICSEEKVIKVISDKDKINEIVNLIIDLNESDKNAPVHSVDAGEVIHALDKNGNLLVNFYDFPYVGLEKGNSFYKLEINNQKLLLKLINSSD